MYKITDCWFKGYRRIIFQNVLKGHYFYTFGPDFHYFWDCPFAEMIAVLEYNAEKFFSLEDCVEDSMKIIGKMCGYVRNDIPENEYEFYNTHMISNDDVMDWKKGEIYG